MKKSLFLTLAATAVLFAGSADSKEATKFTKEANQALLKYLPFENKKSFEDAKRGFIAPLDQTQVKGASGNLVWDPTKYDFIKGAAPDTVNPSLWRQSKLVNMGGLFEVTKGIYQIRNQDLSNMTIIEGKNGITVMDPNISTEAAQRALALYRKHRGDRTVVAVIYTHSHVDHYGGVRGIIDEKDVKAGKVKIYAPEGFLEEATSENVMAGNAMGRRASYMYGNLLPTNPKGQVGAGLGMTTSAGTVSLIAPTNIIKETGEIAVIDGLHYDFIMAPGSEAPAEFLFYIQELKAINAAEDAAHTLHNTYSLRGAKIRNPLLWSKYINDMKENWGTDATVLFGMHHWPVFGNEDVNKHLSVQRDMYRYINDETLRLANQGLTMVEIAGEFKLPAGIDKSFSNRGYYGSVSHDVKATYVLYLGWFLGNPAHLHDLIPVESSKRYVEMMGGVDAVVEKAQKYFDKGEYRWVAQVVDHAVFTDPKNKAARNLQADALEQLGYQAESGPWRNFYLTGAKELRDGVMILPTPVTASPDTIAAMSLDQLFDYFSMRLNREKANGKVSTLNFNFTDTKEKIKVEMVNSVLNHSLNKSAKNPDATVTLSRTTLNNILVGKTTFDKELKNGNIKVEGSEAKFTDLVSYLDKFDFWFNIVTP